MAKIATKPIRGNEALERSDERFTLLVESVKDYAIFMLDPKGNVVTWNVGAGRIKGYSASEIVGRHFSIFYPDADVRSGKCETELEAATRDGHFEDEGWRIRKDGTRFWADVVITALRDSHDRLLGFAKVTRDLTERRREENEKLRLLAQARDSNRLRDEFLATVSHELRTPLNAILGWATILETRADNAETAKIAETICRNAKAQARLIEDILDISTIISGNFRIDVRPVDLSVIVRDALEVVRPAANAKNIVIENEGAGSIVLVGDPARLQQVVWNLLSNAVKFTPAGGTIFVQLEQTGATVKLRVRDTGKGIEPSMLGHVFERFRQADTSTTRRHGGLGLGLAIVRHLVELHGGEVFASSEGVDKGATFDVHLPVRAVKPHVQNASSTRDTEEAKSAPYVTTHLDGIKVLVVDDEPDARELLYTLLSSQGAIVRTVGSAAEGRKALSSERPNVLVSDIGMPDEDGYDFIRGIRASTRELGGRTPSIALTAYAREGDSRRALDAGYDRYIAKPVDPEELLSVVRALALAPAKAI